MDGNGSVHDKSSPATGNDSGLHTMDYDDIPKVDSVPTLRTQNINFITPDDSMNKNLHALKSRGISVNLSSDTLQQQLHNQTANLTVPHCTNPKKRRNIDSSAETAVSANALKNNRFALLASLEIKQTKNQTTNIDRSSNVDMHEQTSKSSINNYNNNETSNAHSRRNDTSGINKKTTSSAGNASNRFCPPIVLYNVDIKSLADQFRRNFPDINIKIINKSKYSSHLYIQDYDAYTQMLALLKKKGISSHTFTPIQDKQITLIIRGLHHLMTTAESKEELDSIVPGVVANVNEFLTPHMRKNNLKTNLFRVSLLPGKTLKDISRVNFIAFQKISWEKPNDTTKQVQCKKCQRWGHIAKNCLHPYQCVKCNNQHEPGHCTLNKSDDSMPFCINCKKFGHPANFKGCDIYKKFLTAKLNASKNTTRQVTVNSSLVTANKSYASLFSNNAARVITTNSNHNSKLINDFLAIAKELFHEETITVEQRIENFITNFKSMSTENRKSECMKILNLLNNQNAK